MCDSLVGLFLSDGAGVVGTLFKKKMRKCGVGGIERGGDVGEWSSVQNK
jgi:hypothetical protein